MRKTENDCVGCPTYCADCGARNALHFYCDVCGDETKLYYFDGEELCSDCLLEKFEVVGGSE